MERRKGERNKRERPFGHLKKSTKREVPPNETED